MQRYEAEISRTQASHIPCSYAKGQEKQPLFISAAQGAVVSQGASI